MTRFAWLLAVLAFAMPALSAAQTPVTIANLPPASTLLGPEIVPIDQNTSTVRTTVNLIASYTTAQILGQPDTWLGLQTFQGDIALDNTVASGNRGVLFNTSGSRRFIWGLSSMAETGGNAGSNLQACRYSDAAAFLDCPIVMNRATGNVGFGDGLSGVLTGSVNGPAAYLTNYTTIGMTGDVVYTSGPYNGSGSVSGPATIQPGVVTPAKMAAGAAAANIGTLGGALTGTLPNPGLVAIANSGLAQMPALTIKCNPTAGTAPPQDCSETTVSTMVGGGTGGGPAPSLTPGASIAMTGDVVWNSGTFTGASNLSAAGTIQPGAVTGAKIASATITSTNLAAGAVASGNLAAGAAIANMGFTPPQQGTGAGQGANVIKLGWGSSGQGFKLQVDATDEGTICVQNTAFNCVWTFNGRSGAITLLYADVTAALGFTPASINDSRFAGPPQNYQAASYTFQSADAGAQIYHPTSDATARTWTIPSNASVPYAVGTKIDVVNDCGSGAITLTINSDTLVFFPTGSTGTRTIAACGEATLSKVTATRWILTGVGVS